jgi:hypothetical protein
MKDKGGRDGGKGDYDIGFGRPPKETQFKSGQSGNPRGRPRGEKNTATLFNDVLNEKVVITEKGARKAINKRKAVFKQLVNKAAGGDLKSISLVLAEIRLLESRLETAAQSAVARFEEEDLKVIEELNRQFGKGGKNDGGNGSEEV